MCFFWGCRESQPFFILKQYPISIIIDAHSHEKPSGIKVKHISSYSFLTTTQTTLLKNTIVCHYSFSCVPSLHLNQVRFVYWVLSTNYRQQRGGKQNNKRNKKLKKIDLFFKAMEPEFICLFAKLNVRISRKLSYFGKQCITFPHLYIYLKRKWTRPSFYSNNIREDLSLFGLWAWQWGSELWCLAAGRRAHNLP